MRPGKDYMVGKDKLILKCYFLPEAKFKHTSDLTG